MVVHSDGKRDFRLVLSDDMLVQMRFDLCRRRQLNGVGRAVRHLSGVLARGELFFIFIGDFGAERDAVLAQVHIPSEHVQRGQLRVRSSAEIAVHFSDHSFRCAKASSFRNSVGKGSACTAGQALR